MKTLGIIGTAGRGTDGFFLKNYWKSMCTVAQVVAELVGAEAVVSGGASYADHIAVRLFLDGQVKALTLHLAAEFTPFGFKETSSRFDCGRTSNHYHQLFKEIAGVDSIAEIQLAIERGAVVHARPGGFKARNTDIAMDADVMLAFTFGDGPKLKDGGTLDTMTKYLARRGVTRPIGKAAFEGMADECDTFWAPAYHFDLTTKRLYTI